MEHGASRRAFLTGRVARDAVAARDAVPRAPLPRRCGTLAELRTLAAQHGLGGRVADVERLARTSVRLDAAGSSAPPGWSQVGGRPALQDEADWPRRKGRRLPFLAQIALEELPAAPTGWAQEDGLLLLFADPESGAVTATEAPLPRRSRWPRRNAPRRTGIAVAFAAESTLPRAWAAPVQALDLEPPERDAWQRLRSAWAVEQGAELEDEARATRIVHRLGGYPDERRGMMPALCELRSVGIAADELDPHGTVAEHGLEDRLPRWRLLAQLASDPVLGWEWGARGARLYIWAAGDDPGTATALVQ